MESQVVEQPLALSNTQFNTVLLRQVMAEKFTVPLILGVSQITWGASQVTSNPPEEFFVQRGGAACSEALLQTGKPTLLKAPYPVLNSAAALAHEFRHFRATAPGTHEKNAMQSMVITGFLRTENLVLNRDPHKFGIVYFQFAHDFPPPVPIGR
jgi:hypothetical protein